jgi:type VI secretion system (T6SS) effector TldE1-like protein
MWYWGSKTGALLGNTLQLKQYGYAGRGEGRNNPSMQDQKGIGPIPEGYYTIEAPHTSTVTGPYSLRLVPDASNQMFGRSSFAIHGDSASGDASHGCIVVARKYRQEIWESGDHRLRVIAI